MDCGVVKLRALMVTLLPFEERGLRQGDLYLLPFHLGMEGLHNAFEEALEMFDYCVILRIPYYQCFPSFLCDIDHYYKIECKDMDNIIRVLHVYLKPWAQD
ncbi:hypothetical protein Tco_0583042 [Tanacetum coccineum]